MKKERNSNFELMRIVSMLVIILSHIILHGNMLTNCDNKAIRIILEIIRYLIVFHVNSFVLLSGYFQSKSNFKLSKFLELLLQVIFYSSLIYVLGVNLGIIKSFNTSTLISNILPSSVNNYWFIKAYVVVYILSNIINKLIDSMTRKEYKNTLIVLFLVFSVSMFLTGGNFFVNNGFNFYHFIFLYMIGGYLRRYPLKETYYFKKLTKNGYRALLIFVFFLIAFLNYSINEFAYKIDGLNGIMNIISDRIIYSRLDYSTPFAIIQSVCYFLLFESFNFKNKFINVISGCVFGVYLFHDNPYMRNVIYKFFMIDSGNFSSYSIFLKVLIALICIFIIGVVIELIRKFLIWLLFKFKLINKIVDKFKKIINSFGFSINW